MLTVICVAGAIATIVILTYLGSIRRVAPKPTPTDYNWQQSLVAITYFEGKLVAMTERGDLWELSPQEMVWRYLLNGPMVRP